jgi:hypothetical protein
MSTQPSFRALSLFLARPAAPYHQAAELAGAQVAPMRLLRRRVEALGRCVGVVLKRVHSPANPANGQRHLWVWKDSKRQIRLAGLFTGLEIRSGWPAKDTAASAASLQGRRSRGSLSHARSVRPAPWRTPGRLRSAGPTRSSAKSVRGGTSHSRAAPLIDGWRFHRLPTGRACLCAAGTALARRPSHAPSALAHAVRSRSLFDTVLSRERPRCPLACAILCSLDRVTLSLRPCYRVALPPSLPPTTPPLLSLRPHIPARARGDSPHRDCVRPGDRQL